MPERSRPFTSHRERRSRPARRCCRSDERAAAPLSGRIRLVVKVALAIGGLIDGSVAIVMLFFQPLLGPLLDVPVRDPAFATIAGGETAVVTLVYVAIFRDLDRFAPLLWLVALDQSLAVVLPALEIVRGHIVASVKTIAPIPGNAALAAIFIAGAARAGRPAR